MTGQKKIFRYRHIANEIEQKIVNGTCRPGEKLPSIRKLHRQTNLSISTIYRAYVELEALGLVQARPKSGYYVDPVLLKKLKVPRLTKRSFPPKEVRLSSMINSVISAISNPHMVPLGSTVVDSTLMPLKPFARILKQLSQAELRSLISYSLSEGYPELRRQITLRSVGVLHNISSEEIIITNGCMEAVALAMRATTRPGDTVAIESPTNFGYLQLLQELGLMVMEVPTDPRHGIDLNALEKIFQNNRIKACLLVPNFHNPTGALMPGENKMRLVQMSRRFNIPIVEDDISAELNFTAQRPVPLKAHDRHDLVLTCSSFSKTLAPGLRIGWIIPGKRFKEKIQNMKAATTVCTSTLDQYLIAAYLSGGAYERHLRKLGAALKKQMMRTAVSIQAHFPSDTRLALPGGGTLLWVQLPSSVDSFEVYRQALDHQISIIPGGVCSNYGQFNHFIQISFGTPFSSRIENGLSILGRIVTSLLKD